MANITNTQGTSILALQSIAHEGVVISSAIDVSTKLAATVFIRFGRRSGSLFTTGWPNFRIEASAKSTGNDAWLPLAMFQPSIGTSYSGTSTIAARNLNGEHAAGATELLIKTAVTNLAAGDLIFIEASTFTDSEWARVRKVVTGTLKIYLEEGLVNTHQDDSAIYDQAELFVAQLDLTAIGRIRVVADNANSGQPIAVEVQMVTGDSLT
ncbi:MAG: hypothetical protein WA117_08415 [Verrucomicrobiia bacterium]